MSCDCEKGAVGPFPAQPEKPWRLKATVVHVDVDGPSWRPQPPAAQADDDDWGELALTIATLIADRVQSRKERARQAAEDAPEFAGEWPVGAQVDEDELVPEQSDALHEAYVAAFPQDPSPGYRAPELKRAALAHLRRAQRQAPPVPPVPPADTPDEPG